MIDRKTVEAMVMDARGGSKDAVAALLDLHEENHGKIGTARLEFRIRMLQSSWVKCVYRALTAPEINIWAMWTLEDYKDVLRYTLEGVHDAE